MRRQREQLGEVFVLREEGKGDQPPNSQWRESGPTLILAIATTSLQGTLMFRFAVVLSLAAFTVPVSATPFGSTRTLDGKVFDPAGKVVIVNYWATWCVPCRAEMPVLDSFYRKHHGQGLQMLAISIDDGASTAKLRQATGNFAFPIARINDVKMPRRDIPKAIPVTRIYDKSGKLIFATKSDGRTVIDAATLERVVDPLLAR